MCFMASLFVLSLRTRHTLQPLAWHWSHWLGLRPCSTSVELTDNPQVDMMGVWYTPVNFQASSRCKVDWCVNFARSRCKVNTREKEGCATCEKASDFEDVTRPALLVQMRSATCVQGVGFQQPCGGLWRCRDIIFIELMTSDHELKASREGSK